MRVDNGAWHTSRDKLFSIFHVYSEVMFETRKSYKSRPAKAFFVAGGFLELIAKTAKDSGDEDAGARLASMETAIFA